jgi:hypothetical protein
MTKDEERILQEKATLEEIDRLLGTLRVEALKLAGEAVNEKIRLIRHAQGNAVRLNIGPGSRVAFDAGKNHGGRIEATVQTIAKITAACKDGRGQTWTVPLSLLEIL